MAVKKMTITKGGVTRGIDLTTTTATPETVLLGYTFKQADGTDGVGMYEPEVGVGDVSTESDMTTLAAKNEVGYITRYSGETTENYENGRVYILVEEGVEEVTLTIEEDTYHWYPVGQETYLSLTKPTSADDYDYESWASTFPATVTIPTGTTIYVWGGYYSIESEGRYSEGCGSTYDTATEIVVTKDMTITLLFTVDSGSAND